MTSIVRDWGAPILRVNTVKVICKILRGGNVYQKKRLKTNRFRCVNKHDYILFIQEFIFDLNREEQCQFGILQVSGSSNNCRQYIICVFI